MLVGPKKLLRCAAVLCILKWWNKSQFKCFFAVSECAFWTKILAQTQGQEFVIRMADICRISAEIRTQTNWCRVILMLDPLIRRINTIRITNSQIREPECGYLSDIWIGFWIWWCYRHYFVSIVWSVTSLWHLISVIRLVGLLIGWSIIIFPKGREKLHFHQHRRTLWVKTWPSKRRKSAGFSPDICHLDRRFSTLY